MLAWKEKVAERLSRLIADSPVSPSPGPAAVQPPLATSLPAEHFTSPKKSSLSSYVLSLLPTSNSGPEQNSPCSGTLRPLPPESLPKRWRGSEFTWQDLPQELSEESGSESERDERNGDFSKNQVHQSYRSVGNSNGNEETSTSDCAGALHYLTEKSMFVSPKLFAFFDSSLPGTLKGCHWVLLYSTWKHGISLRTLLRRTENIQGPCLLIVGDMKGAVFGGLLNSPLRPTEKRKYQGTNQTFVFTTIHGEPRLFRPTGANRFYYLCLNDALAFGGGGSFALCVDEDLLHGSSGSCDTFGNSCLAYTPEFELKNVEIYSRGSGQRINLQKSTLFFGVHCPDHIKQRVKDSLQVLKGRYYPEGSFLDSAVTRSCSFTWRSLMFDASRILQIPLTCNRVPDCVSWPWTKTGTFTVKSAYIMARCQQVHLKTSAQGKGATSNQDLAANDWKRLWKIKVPPKMLIMLWRFVHDCLPTGQQLKNRNITASEVCCHCAREENLHHTFIGCQYVAEVWKELKKQTGLKINQKWCGSARNWLFDILSRCTSRETTILAIAFWHIWEARNAMRNGETELHPWCLVEKILAYVDMVFLHCYQSISPKRCESTMPNQWSPPPEGWIMINVDAAIFADANRMGLGLVVRDHRGEFLAAFRQGIDKITNPELAETIAFRRALFFVMQLPYDKVVVASDCLTLINKLRSRKVDRSHTGIIVEDIKQLMRVSSVVFSFIHVSRNCNEVAHALAKSADQLCVSEWFHSPPELILSKLCNDRR